MQQFKGSFFLLFVQELIKCVKPSFSNLVSLEVQKPPFSKTKLLRRPISGILLVQFYVVIVVALAVVAVVVIVAVAQMLLFLLLLLLLLSSFSSSAT